MAKKTALSKETIPFTSEGIKSFNKLQEAIVYFVQNQKIAESSVIALYNETYSYRVGSLSINLAKYYKQGKFSEQEFVNFLERRNVIRNEKQRQLILSKVNVLIQSWEPVLAVKALAEVLPTEPTV